MHLGNVFDDGQAQPSAPKLATARFIGAIETFENTRQVCFRNSDSSIDDADRHRFIPASRLQPNLAAAVGIFHRVIEQIVKDLLQSSGISVYHWNRRAQRDVNTEFFFSETFSP